MKRTVSALILALVLVLPKVAEAAKKIPLKVCAGNYQGSGLMQSLAGDSFSYGPIFLAVSNSGKISGQARRYDFVGSVETIVTLTGRIKRVKRSQGKYYQCSLVGAISDGARFSGPLDVFGRQGGGGVITILSGDFRGGAAFIKE